MKKKLIIFIILFCVLLAGGGVGIYFVNAANEAVVSFDESDAKYATTLKETPTNGTKPDDYDSLTNIYYALYNLEHKEAFSCITTGEAKASVATQAISNSRVVIGDEALVSTISDGIIKIGTQKYFVNKGEKVLLRTHQSISDCKAIWKTDTPECITTDAYILRYGWLPFKAIGYIICDDTVLEASPLKYENGAYEITLNLDPNGDKAPFWYRREVATNGSSTMIPEFSLINLTYRFDENWNVLSVHAQEKYLVKSMGIKTTCETNCYDTYTYDNVSFDKDSYDFFQQYKDLSAKEGSDDVKVDALTMLTSSLANEETGENLDLSIKFNDKLVEGLCSIDITDLNNLKVKVLAKDLYVEYSDYLYISLGNLKLKSDTESLKALLDEFNGTIPNVEAIDTAGILAAFDNAKIEEIDNETVVNVTFNLLGYDINLEYSTYKDDVDYILNYVKVNALVEGNLVEINARPSTNIFPQIDKRSFSDLSNLDYLFSFFSKLIVDKKVEANFDINYENLKANLALKAVFDDTISLKLDLDLKYKNKSFLIDITYIDDVIYLSYDDIHLMISKDDLVSLINKYTNNSLEGGINVTELIEKVMEFDFSNLIKETQITDSSFYLKTNLEDLIGLKDDILLTLKEGEDINLELILNKLNLVGNIKTNKDLNITLEEENYSNIYNLKPVIDELLSLINNKKISLSLNLNYQGIDISADAKIDFNDLENIKAKAQINLTKDNNNLEIELTYLNDILYIDFANNKLSINKDSIILLLNKFNISFDSNENIIDQLLSIDFEQMIKEFTILENEIYINLDLSILKESLNDIKASIIKTNDGLNINVNLFDLDIFVKSFDEEINIIGEYQSLDNLLSLVDNIKTIIENKKIALDLNLSYEDINISANAIVDFNDI
ncbi:MAG: hypothetical protein IKP12_07680, partial [Acholeplasmatales bacterium]|nr:hypothetical protein [Acholeplasmatales bacterium]